MVKLDIPLVKHLSLGGVDNPGNLAYPELWRQLTHLTIKNCIDAFGPFVLELPSLISLRLIVCGLNLRHINAPKLEELTFTVAPIDTSGGWYEMLKEDVPFTPRIIHIDVLTSEVPEDDLEAFGMKLPLWSKVEELHLKVVGDFPCLNFVVVHGISGVSPRGCYPKLHSITVLSPIVPEDDEDSKYIPKETLIEEMEEILKRRRSNKDLAPLQKLEVGWYVQWGDDYAESEWKVVEWDDCLRW